MANRGCVKFGPGGGKTAGPSFLDSLVGGFDAVVVSDYNKHATGKMLRRKRRDNSWS
jgi:hypothetical protein